MSPNPADPEARRQMHERTWEMELLISGALVVALFQLPRVLESAFDSVVYHVSRDLFLLPFLVYYLGTLVLYSLIGTFIVHILLRGFWIGLVGLDKAFPAGIRWERLKLGPLMREEQQRSLVRPDSLEDLADRAASALFSLLFATLAMFFWLGLVTTLALAAAWLSTRSGVLGLSVIHAFFVFYVAIYAVVLGPMAAVTLLDRWYARRDREAPRWLCRAVPRAFRWFRALSLGALWVPITYVVTSNAADEGQEADWRHGLLFSGLLLLPLAAFFAATLGPELAPRLNSYLYYPPGSGAWELEPSRYDSLRSASSAPGRPTLSEVVAEGPYLRLFIPYEVRHDNEDLARLCPDLDTFHADGTLAPDDAPDDVDARARQVLDCFGQLYSATLDGDRLELELLFTTHPGSGRRGVVSMIPVRGLEEGRHLLQVTRHEPPEDAEDGDESEGDEDEVTPLPFWR